MKLAVMSDSHDRWDNLEKAIGIAVDKGVEQLLFAGDFMSPPGMSVIGKFPGPVVMVWGNNDGEQVGLLAQAREMENVSIAGDEYEGELGGRKVYMQHYPRPAEIAVESGMFDIVIYGHTHEWREETANGKLLLNPGEIQGYRTGMVSFALVDTGSLEVEKIIINNS